MVDHDHARDVVGFRQSLGGHGVRVLDRQHPALGIDDIAGTLQKLLGLLDLSGVELVLLLIRPPKVPVRNSLMIPGLRFPDS